jgi:hypothetical protein
MLQTLLLFSSLAMAHPVPDADGVQESVFRTLSQRHDPGCETVEALSSTPVEHLLAMTEFAMPPWVPMRAAACLATRHTDAVRPQLDAWVTDPNTKGLMLAVVGLLDQMPETHALQLAELAVTKGSDPAAAASRILRSDNTHLRAIATGSTP